MARQGVAELSASWGTADGCWFDIGPSEGGVTMTFRPDPLAPLPERPRKPPKPLVSATCGHHGSACNMPTVQVLWFGCTKAEHAGPIGYCTSHAEVIRQYQGSLTCEMCGRDVAMKILKTEPYASYLETP
jgi:hypothetical protein